MKQQLAQLEKMKNKGQGKEKDYSKFKTGGCVDMQRVYYPCVYVSSECYQQLGAIVKVVYKDGEIVTRCLPSIIPNQVCSLFKIFENKIQYSEVNIYKYQSVLRDLSIKVKPMEQILTQKSVSSYLHGLFQYGVYFPGQLVEQAVNGQSIKFQVQIEEIGIYNRQNFTLLNLLRNDKSVFDMSGFSSELIDLYETVMQRTTNISSISSSLMFGPPGHGKTTFVNRTVNPLADFGVSVKFLEGEQVIQQILESEYDASLLFCDEIDELNEEMQQQLAITLQNIGNNVFFIGATNKPENLINELKSAFNQQIEVVQDQIGKLSQISQLINDHSQAHTISVLSKQFSPADIDWLIRNSFDENNFSLIKYMHQIKIYQPSGLKGLEMQTPEQAFGHEKIINQIQECIQNNIMHNFLLFGPPGTGKNQIIKHFANLNFKIPVSSASEVVGPYVGQSEKALDRLFKQASLVFPAIIFIDEIDGLFSDKSQPNQRLLTVFLDLLDQKMVIVIAASNRPWILPAQVLQRFESCYISPLSAIQAQKMIQNDLQQFVSFDFAQVGQLCENCTGATIKSAIFQVKQQLLKNEISGINQEIDMLQYFEFLEKVSESDQSKFLEYLK